MYRKLTAIHYQCRRESGGRCPRETGLGFLQRAHPVSHENIVGRCILWDLGKLQIFPAWLVAAMTRE